MTRWKLTIEYDGGGFSGLQRQEPGVPSVQQAIEDAFFGFCQQRLTLTVAGRTDAGVHARAQVAHVDLDYGERLLSGGDLAKAVNAHLRPQAISVINAEIMPADFHARFSATNKLYTYLILNRPAPPALETGHVWHVRRPLDVDAMNAAAKHLLGHHDFSTFRDTACQAKTPDRTLDRLDVETRDYDGGGREILIHAEARSFLHHMVRNIVGTLSLVGDHKWTPAQVKEALELRDRTKGGPTAPSDGLYLMRVDYK
jgi:tRNA pseudouridine38-40 synthase